MENKKTIYKKLQDVRCDLQKMGLKKSGKNSYSNFDYYELADFLPSVNELCSKHGLCTHFYIERKDVEEYAVLRIVDVEVPTDEIQFTIPTAEVEIGKDKFGKGGAQPIQNLGGKITYCRRYLMLVAFEIVETDVVDRTPSVAKMQEKPEPKKTDNRTLLILTIEKMVKRILDSDVDITTLKGMSDPELTALARRLQEEENRLKMMANLDGEVQ